MQDGPLVVHRHNSPIETKHMQANGKLTIIASPMRSGWVEAMGAFPAGLTS